MQRKNTPSVGDFVLDPGKPRIPLSMMARIKDEIWLWYSSAATLIPMTADSEDLKQSGFKPLSHDPSKCLKYCFMLHSQYMPCLICKEDGKDIFLAKPHDIEALEKCPVQLASILSHPETIASFSTNRAYPPKEHGTIGIITSTEEWRYYTISMLPIEAQERQKQLSQKLEELAARPTPSIPLVFVEEEVKTMIQQLAQDYYQHHTLTRIPAPRSVFEDGIAKTPSCLPFQAAMASIHAAVSRPELWSHPEDQAPFFFFQKPSGSHIVQYKTGRKGEVFNSKTTASLWDKVQQLSDSSNDVLLDLFAHFIRPSELDGTTWFFASQYLDDRGLKKITKGENAVQRRTAGHRHEDMAEVGYHLDLLENIWITIDQAIDELSDDKKKRKKRQFTHQGRLFMIEERITQKDLHGDDRSDLEIAWRIRPGSWLRPFLESPNRQVANLFQKSLQYDPFRQQWEKRLSRYFMLFGHMETRGGGGTFNRNIKKLLQEVSLSVEDANPKRTKDRFERAMNQLIEDSIIHEWHYQGSIDTSRRGWVTRWLDLMVTIYIAPTKQIM